MSYACTPANFPSHTYFSQNEIPTSGPPGYDWDYVRGLVIRAEGAVAGGGALTRLRLSMSDYLSDSGAFPGIKRVQGTDWKTYISQLFALGIAPPTPFDFRLWFRSRVIIYLAGDFWRFSTKLAPFTTKHQYADQYFDLLLHHMDGGTVASISRSEWESTRPDRPCKCISFYAGEPCRDSGLPAPVSPKVLHGFSLNIEIGRIRADGTIDPTEALPITIDPDIENKGGHGFVGGEDSDPESCESDVPSPVSSA